MQSTDLVVSRPKLTQAGAQAILNGALKRAIEMKIKVCIAIVDDSALLLNFHRQDDARISSIAISLTKAESAALRRSPTQPIDQPNPNDKIILNVSMILASKSEQTTLRGGFPIFFDSHIIGAIGVSGGTVDEDSEIATSGVKAFEEARLKSNSML